jgi:hypothetical protein
MPMASLAQGALVIATVVAILVNISGWDWRRRVSVCVRLAVYIWFVLSVEASLLVYVTALIVAVTTIVVTWRLRRRGPVRNSG